MRRRVLAAAALASAALGAGAVATAGQADLSPPVPPAASSVLPAGTIDGPNARAAAAAFGSRIEMPDGANLNGIRWEQSGTSSAGDVAFTVSYNVACQWLRAFGEGRQVPRARAVLATVARWPAFQGVEGAEGMELAAQQALAGQPGVEFRTVNGDCFETRAREQQYARSLGLVPTQ